MDMSLPVAGEGLKQLGNGVEQRAISLPRLEGGERVHCFVLIHFLHGADRPAAHAGQRVKPVVAVFHIGTGKQNRYLHH